ncbi:DUF2267 domain-containing protein [Fulvivirga sediminis]|uniref:DUF2267 domain-containing protein n=1 Tax=Fulvivirga sediminis TaxID=2803949 RepID=A0A937K0H3_9BACT|nr:DUF2267 domain-containing protein [Fulvivirga sediminis]MBL3658358.1 DUF2267 domain-containing protein [Fulvivirga sediminis]
MELNYNKLAMVDKGCIKELDGNLNYGCYIKTGRLLSLVLHTLRNSFTYHQSAQFIEQLSNPLKIIYIQNWKICPPGKPLKKIDHITEVAFRRNRYKDLWHNKMEANEAITATLKVLYKHIDFTSTDFLEDSLKKEIMQLCTIKQ